MACGYMQFQIKHGKTQAQPSISRAISSGELYCCWLLSC